MKNCPICESESLVLKKGIMFAPPEHSDIWKEISRDYNILKCGDCGLEFCDPMPTDKVLRTLYSKTYKNPRATDEIVVLNAKKNIKLLKNYGLSRKSKLMDFGSGADDCFVKTGNSKNWQGYDPYLNLTKKEKLGENYDFVTLWGVLEHLIDPVKELKNINEMLNGRGKIVITTVFNPFTNIPYNHKPPEHTLYFTEESIKRLFKKTGFKILEYSPYMMWQKPEVYFWCIFNSSRMPEKIRKKVQLNFKGNILVPTNEVFVVGEKV